MTGFFLSFAGAATLLVLGVLTLIAVGDVRATARRKALSAVMRPVLAAKDIQIAALEREVTSKATEIRTLADETRVITAEERASVIADESESRQSTILLSDTQLCKVISQKVERVQKMAEGS